MKLIVIFFVIVFWTPACTRMEKPERAPQRVKIYDNNLDNKILIGMVDSINHLFIKKKFSAISDSIRFYLYCIFYDDTVRNNDHTASNLFCCYDLLPIRCTLLEDSLLITYNSILFDTIDKRKVVQVTNYINYIQYTYNHPFFVNNNFIILGEVYPTKRKETPNIKDIITFIKKNKVPVNQWFWGELSKREK